MINRLKDEIKDTKDAVIHIIRYYWGIILAACVEGTIAWSTTTCTMHEWYIMTGITALLGTFVMLICEVDRELKIMNS